MSAKTKKQFRPGTPIISNITSKSLIDTNIYFGTFVCVKCSWEGTGPELEKIKILNDGELIETLICPTKFCLSRNFYHLDNYENTERMTSIINNPQDFFLGLVGLLIILIIVVGIIYIFL